MRQHDIIIENIFQKQNNSVCIGVLNQNISNMLITDINVQSESCLCNHLALFFSILDFFKTILLIFLTKILTKKIESWHAAGMHVVLAKIIDTKQNSLRKKWNSRNRLLWNWLCLPWHSHGEYTFYGYLNIHKIKNSNKVLAQNICLTL